MTPDSPSGASQGSAGGKPGDLAEGNIAMGRTAVNNGGRGGRLGVGNRSTPGRGLLQRKALLSNSRKGLDADGNQLKREGGATGGEMGCHGPRSTSVDANDGVDAEGFIVGGGVCNCRHGSAATAVAAKATAARAPHGGARPGPEPALEYAVLY